MIGTLFESQEDRDAEARRRAVAYAYDLLRGTVIPALTETQRGVLRLVVDRVGRAKATSVGELAEQLKSNPRDIKAAVNELRRIHHVRIGSSRDGEAGGYYMIATKDEALDTARPFIRQAQSELAIARAILEPHELAELAGQLQLAGEAL